MVPSKEIVSHFMKELLSFNNESPEAARAGIMEQGLIHRCQARERTGPLPESWPGGQSMGVCRDAQSFPLAKLCWKTKGMGSSWGTSTDIIEL